MGLLSLIKKFVNEGEVIEEELTGDLAVDPITSYKASTNAKKTMQAQDVATEQAPTVQIVRKATRSAETQSTSKTRKTTRKIKTPENDEPEL